MNKTILLVFSVLILFSCKTTRIYVTPDYTDSDILKAEITNIKRNMEKYPVKALWRAYLLSIAVPTDAQTGILFNEMRDNLQKVYANAVENKEYFISDSYSKTLSLFSKELTNNITNTNDTWYNDTISVNLKKNPDNDEDRKVTNYLAGTVTIWVDRGIKLENGIGYADRVIGSGFFIDNKGYLITNYHVVESEVNPEYEGYSRLFIKMSGDTKTRIPAKVIGWDSAVDIALLKTEIDVPYFFHLGSSTDLDVGDPISVIGSPLGLEQSFSSGVVSSINRDIGTLGKVLQIDAAVNFGNSGGPLIDKKGSVQAIIFAGLQEYEGLNFAIPVEYLKRELPALYTGGEVKHSWIGIYCKTKKENPSDVTGIGVEVLYVLPGGIADKTGIKEGDIIKSFDSQEVNCIDDLKQSLITSGIERITQIKIKTEDNREEEKLIYLDERPKLPGKEILDREPLYKALYPLLGMYLVPSSSSDKNQFIIKKIEEGSVADESGFSKNDPIKIVKYQFMEKEKYLYIEIYGKKRKSGYLDVKLAMSAPMDSSEYF